MTDDELKEARLRQNTPEEAARFRTRHTALGVDVRDVWTHHEQRNAEARARLRDLRMHRWRTDYGRGPLEWVVHLKQNAWRTCNLRACLRHPLRSYRWLIRGIES